MNLKDSIDFIREHPMNKGYEKRAVLSFFVWQLKSRLFKGPFIYPFTSKSLLQVEKGMRGATGNIYCGLHEPYEMSFLLHYLRPGELFFDIGANVGSYTVLASAHIGARSVAVEPIPATFKALQNNIAVNKISHLVKPVNCALGETTGTLQFTAGLGAMNHVANKTDTETIPIPVNTMDALLENEVPTLIKIDVEGYETAVIKGGQNTLHDQRLQAIIIELNGAGFQYGYDEDELHLKIVDAGFSPFRYRPFARSLEPIDGHGHHNTIYLRNPAEAQERIRTAPGFTVRDKTL